MLTAPKSETQGHRAPKMQHAIPLLLADHALAVAKVLFVNLQESLDSTFHNAVLCQISSP